MACTLPREQLECVKHCSVPTVSDLLFFVSILRSVALSNTVSRKHQCELENIAPRGISSSLPCMFQTLCIGGYSCL